MLFHHIRKFSSTVKTAAASPAVLYPKNNKVLRILEEGKKSLIEEGNGKKPAAAGPPPLEEISLRPFELTDVDDVMVWATDDQLSRYCWWEELGLKGIYTSKQDALEDIKNYMIPHPWYRAICLKNKPIGKIFIDPYPKTYRFRAEVSYVVASEHWGKGIGTTAVKMALDTVFKEWPHLRRLGSVVHVENLGAQRVLEKAGFLKEGVFRKFCIQKGRTIDTAIFSFLSTDLNQRMD